VPVLAPLSDVSECVREIRQQRAAGVSRIAGPSFPYRILQRKNVTPRLRAAISQRIDCQPEAFGSF
jgi:hypothetical protein